MNLRFAAVVLVVLFVGAPSLESIAARAQSACSRACTAASSPFNPGVIRTLIQQGNNLCNCNCPGANGGGILHIAARSRCGSCIQYLISSPSNCPCNDRDYRGNTPLHIAAASCNGPPTSDFIRADCTVDAQNYAGDTALCLVARSQSGPECGQVARTLLATHVEGGSADPCIRCSGNTTACQSCVQRGVCDVLRQDRACNCPR